MGQVLKEDEELKKLADQYRISAGKAALIQEICKQDKTATFLCRCSKRRYEVKFYAAL